MRDPDTLFLSLERSKCRRQFHLRAAEKSDLQEKTLPVILEHAKDFIVKRLVPAQPLNDGTQTPRRGHPVFVAQHATATCCWGCLSQWHGSQWHEIAPGAPLNNPQTTYVTQVLER
ncbi:MAG: hypothetical protein CBB70_03455 [Planctomycetaceae bacterium TMED10]|nr:MAG: hypothetical protein CBB70_03455 [Planctomycetaceae bacterium TMED10]